MDARAVLKEWIGDPHDPKAPVPLDRRGRRGDFLRGTSPERYADDVLDWLDFIENVVKIGAWHAEPSHIKTWLDMKGGAPRSRARRVSAVGAFYAYAVEFKHVLHNPADPRLSGKAYLTPPAPRLSGGQVHLIRWGADQIEEGFAERDRLLVYLLLAGLRSRQVCEQKLEDLVFEQHRMSANVWQRGGGQRRTGFPNEIRDAVRTYLPVRTWRGPHSHEDRGPLLVTYRGHRLDSQTTPRTVLKVAVDLARACPEPGAPDLPDRVTPDMVALSPSPFTPLKDLTPMTEQPEQRRVSAWAAGLPPMTAVPTGAPTADGGALCILALIPEPDVPAEQIQQFVERFHFVPRQETARAADSQVRWSVEPGGAVTMSFLAEDGVSQLQLPPSPGVREWTALARVLGGTVAVMVMPGMTDTGISAIGHRLGQHDAPYWHLSAGYVEA